MRRTLLRVLKWAAVAWTALCAAGFVLYAYSSAYSLGEVISAAGLIGSFWAAPLALLAAAALILRFLPRRPPPAGGSGR